MSRTVVREFEYAFKKADQNVTLTLSVEVPSRHSIDELVGRLVWLHDIPCYVEDDFKRVLNKFVARATEKYYDDSAEEALEMLRDSSLDTEKLIDVWVSAYTQEVKEYAPKEEANEEHTFHAIYHDLIHSAALDTLLNLEHTYSIDVQDINRAKEVELRNVEKKQQEEMERVVKEVGISYNDDYVNNLAQRQFERIQAIGQKWDNELYELQSTQKREFREWVTKVHEDSKKTQGGISQAFMQKVRSYSGNDPASPEVNRDMNFPEIRMEESFTIHLGAQMKTTHNLRLMSADIMDLCKHTSLTMGGMVVPQPQRLQTAMSLFSNALCGLVMMVDNRLNYYTGIKREFAQVCQQSTDFHFPDLETQFALIKDNVILANDIRSEQKKSSAAEEDGDKVSTKSGSSGTSEQSLRDVSRLNPGDFYITKHSNLSEVHAVFHVVSTDEVYTGDISSRHPVILSLRNILKVCFRHDIFNLTLPLLLTHEMSEEMTIPWCLKRAELVFKCVKGFMMEMASWGGTESRTLQFLVPRGISEDMFGTLSGMLPQIFRVSNPLVVKTT